MNRRVLPWIALGAPLAIAAVAFAADDPNEVTMDLDQFLRLYEETKNRPKDPAKAPRAWAMGSADYVGEVVLDDGEPVSAQFTARLHVDVLHVACPVA